MRDATARWQDEIPQRYWKADLSDLPAVLAERFLALPEDQGLFLWGTPGTGKTHSMAAFARHLWTQGWELDRTTYEDLCLRIRETFGKCDGSSELSVVKPLWEIPKLFIEDVGVTVSLGRQESDFSLRVFETLLDKRLESCLATFVTSNKSIEELARSFDARVASRLCQACDVVELQGWDRRRRGPEQPDHGHSRMSQSTGHVGSPCAE